MGGWLALLAALRFPDKIKGLVCVALLQILLKYLAKYISK
ncbi:hydrolase-like domain protein [Rickettsia amblyommatis str. Darkwater]|nr:hydrolase-like domain protein [Rickettsia amblyommatis str. Darkwater]